MSHIEALCERISNAPQPTEERAEPRFFQVQSDIEKGNYEQASQLMRDLFNEGYFDVRLIAYYLYVYLLENGRKGMVESFKLLRLILETHHTKLYPLSGQKQQSAGAMKWFLTTITRNLKRVAAKVKAGKHSDLWDQMTRDLTEENLGDLREAIQAVAEFFQSHFDQEPQFDEVFSYLNGWIADLAVFIAEPAATDLPEPEVDYPRVETEALEQIVSIEEALETLVKPEPKSKERGSHPWIQLKAKLRLYERLVSEGGPDAEFKRAIVAKDICYVIENFNPAHFFPEEFTEFYSLMAKSKEPLVIEPDSREAFGWNTLNALYQINLEAFENWSRG